MSGKKNFGEESVRNLFLLNVDKSLSKELSKSFNVIIPESEKNLPDNIDAVYIEYIPYNSNNPQPFVLQTETFKFYLKKKIPVVVFDKYLAIKPDEARWLKKQNVKLLEPAINYRPDFRYLPQFCPKIHSIDTLKLNKVEPRAVTIGFKGIIFDKLNSFEKYLVEFGKNYPSFSTKYSDSSNISKEKTEEYTNLNVILDKNLKYSDIKCTVLLGSVRDYTIGYLNPDLFTILENNVIILLPEEHRYYHALFSDTVIKELNDMVFVAQTYDFVYLGYIANVYHRIDKLYPEFKLEHTVDFIKKEIE